MDTFGSATVLSEMAWLATIVALLTWLRDCGLRRLRGLVDVGLLLELSERGVKLLSLRDWSLWAYTSAGCLKEDVVREERSSRLQDSITSAREFVPYIRQCCRYASVMPLKKVYIFVFPARWGNWEEISRKRSAKVK